MDTFMTFLSIGSFLADIGTDVIVIIQYYMSGHILWMLLTTSLVCLPSLVVQIFSIRWYIIDGTITNFLWFVHILQLGVFQRYIQLLSLGLKVRESNDQMELQQFNQQQSDICMLRLFESFMESAPQLVLQLYIMVSTDEWNPWTGISALASIFSLSWGIAAYSKALRNAIPEKKNLSWWGLLFQSLWRIGMVSSRVFSMVLFAAAYGSWLILAMAIHWFCMTVWVFLQDTDFCTTWWEERLYNCVVGIIYCFCYFNVKEGKSRFRMSLYYFLTILQNLGFLLAFYAAEHFSQGLKFLMIFSVPSGIFVGIISMLLYYRFFHPSGPIALFKSKSPDEGNVDTMDTSRGKQCNCCTLKTCRKLKENENEVLEYCPSTDFVEEHPETLNYSKISVKSIDDKSISCAPDLHRSHSLNCSYGSHDMSKDFDTSFAIGHRKSLANHHRNINYHFRPAVNNGLLLSKIHCSCLVLMRNTDKNFKDISTLPTINHSTSLPNLEGSFESDHQIGSSFTSYIEQEQSVLNILSNRSSEVNCSSSELEHFPVIDNDHVVRINV